MTCAPRMNAFLAEGDRPVVVGEVLAVGRGQQRTQVQLAECLRTADAAGGSDRNRKASDVGLRQLRARDAHVVPRARRRHFRVARADACGRSGSGCGNPAGGRRYGRAPSSCRAAPANRSGRSCPAQPARRAASATPSRRTRASGSWSRGRRPANRAGAQGACAIRARRIDDDTYFDGGVQPLELRDHLRLRAARGSFALFGSRNVL